MTPPPICQNRILIVDNPAIVDGPQATTLAEDNIPVEHAHCGDEALSRLEEGFELLIVPDNVDGMPVADYLSRVQRRFPKTGVIVVTTPANIDLGAAALEAGATDYLVAPTTPAATMAAVRRALHHRQLKNELAVLRQTVAMANGFDNLVGLSESMVKLKETARKLAPTDISVLISGSSGSGKELLARVMHHHSQRRAGAFVAVDFSAIPEESVARVLFGHDEERSTGDGFTGGLLEKADGGTLFLDNVDRAPISVQKRLALFLRDPAIITGAIQIKRKIEIRVMAAASQDLTPMLADGSYDAELYRLISEMKLNLPTLSERPEDIELLIDYFLRRWQQETGRDPVTIGPDAIEKLLVYRWPGNVRELDNCLRRAATLCRDNMLQTQDISFFGHGPDVVVQREHRILHTRRPGGRLDDTQRSIIARALEDNDWNFTQTAQELGIGRTTLWRKVKKYQLTREPSEIET